MIQEISQRLRRAARRAFPAVPEKRTIHRTSFLDGLRGFAAVIVTLNHHCMARKRYFQEPFTLGPYLPNDNPMDFTNPMQLPIVRVVITGGAMVPIFFVISGYVLSFRQVQMIRERQLDKLSESLFSLAFRRPFRLFLPSIGGIILYQISNEMKWNAQHMPTKLSLVSRLLGEIYLLFNGVWGVPPGTLWLQLQQLWTIPLEYFGSMAVFIMLMANSRLKYSWRMSIIIGAIVMTFYGGQWPVGTFFGGLLIAELESPVEKEVEWEDKPKRQRLVTTVRSSIFNIFWFMTLIMGLVLAGWPEAKFARDPLLSKLPPISPKHLARENGIKWFWLGISGIQIVWCVFKSPVLQRMFTTRFALYLGDISYSLYIVHYYLTLTLSPKIHNLANSLFGVDRGSHLNQICAVAFELFILLFVAVWQADVYWKYVDKPCVTFSKWVERKALM
jgi:peptidoglycan/LPS O-acetylase OafA/YrhL